MKIKYRTLFAVLSISCILGACRNEKQFPLSDLHIHLKGDFTIDDAVKKSADEGITYGIAVNCGLKFPIHLDSQIDSVISTFSNYPQFFIAMQAEGREWVTLFSKESIGKFDYVFTDGMTFTDEKGRRNRIWIKEETWIDDEQQFMNYLTNTIVKILNEEPINIYVNPSYLPEQMMARYDEFWTEERMDKIINALKDNNIALEINNRYRIPSYKFLKKAKEAGVKFTVGTNNTNSNFSGAVYAQEMIKKLGLTRGDFYQPVKRNRVNGQL
jgi:hypothetical protein